MLPHIHVVRCGYQGYKAPTCREVFQWLETVKDCAVKKKVAAIMAMEMIQNEMAQQSWGGKKSEMGIFRSTPAT